MRDNTARLSGNVTRTPELRYTNSGSAVTDFSIAWRPPKRPDAPEPQTEYFDVECWAGLAEHAAASIQKGDRVLVSGRLRQDKWQGDDGSNRQRVLIVAEDVAMSVMWSPVQVENRTDGPPNRGQSSSSSYNGEPF